MNNRDIIIIGGGAAGLMAARQLSEEGYAVTLLEAQTQLGGRIHTLHEDDFAHPVEAGAEFLHGNVPFTIQLLKEAGIEYTPVGEEMWQYRDGRLQKNEEGYSENPKLARLLKELKEDISVKDFLDKNFSGPEDRETYKSIKNFAEGYEAADLQKASMMSIGRDLLQEDSEEQYRTIGGYRQMIEYLADRCTRNGCNIILHKTVRKISWHKGLVKITTLDGQEFAATKVLVTVPLSILQLNDVEQGAIQFKPSLPQNHLKAINTLGYGTAIKVLLEFDAPFWKKTVKGEDTSGLSFVFGNTSIPTWWTQTPLESNLITGWLAGPSAARLRDKDDADITALALDSLSEIFGISKDLLLQTLKASYVGNWAANNYIRGAYSYASLDGANAIRALRDPVAGTIFFAGEALYEGRYAATVEAALTSAVNVVKDIMDSSD